MSDTDDAQQADDELLALLGEAIEDTNAVPPWLTRFANESHRLLSLAQAVIDEDVERLSAQFRAGTDSISNGAIFDRRAIPAATERANRVLASAWELIAARMDRARLDEFEQDALGAANDQLTNERLATSVAAALYRLDRQDIALDLLNRSRRALRSDLGLEPGTEFARIEAAILRRDPLPAEPVRPVVESALERQVEPAAYLAQPSARFVGRDNELDALRDELAQSRSGRRGRFVLVQGEAGAGKSEIIRQFAHEAGAFGATVRVGQGATHESAAYGPFLSALPELDEDLAAIAATTDQETARLRVWREVSRQLAGIATGRGAVVILEDLHEADSQSAFLLRYLVSGLPAGLMLVATSRPPIPDTAWAEVHTGMVMSSLLSGSPTVVDMLPFDRETTSDFVRRHFPTAAPAQIESFAAHLVDISGGNPLVMESICNSIERPTDLRTQAWGDSPEQVFVKSLDTRSDEALDELLGVAGVIGLEFDLEKLATLLDRESAGVQADLLRARNAGFVYETGVPYRHRFDHVLTRDYFVAELPLARKRALAAELALATGSSATARVRWLRMAGNTVELDLALELLRQDEQRLSEQSLFAESVAAGELALAMLEENNRTVPLKNLVDLAITTAKAGDFELSGAYRKRAFADATRIGEADAMARAATAGLPEAENVDGDPIRLQMLLDIDHHDLVDFPKGWFATCLFREAWLVDDHELCERVQTEFSATAFGGDTLGAAAYQADLMTYANQTGQRSFGSADFEEIAAELEPSPRRAYVRFQGLIHGIISNEEGAATNLFDDVRAEVVAFGTNRIRWTTELLWSALTMSGARNDGPTPEETLGFGTRYGIADSFGGYGAQHLMQLWLQGNLKQAHAEIEALGDGLHPGAPWRAMKALAAAHVGESETAEAERDRVMAVLSADRLGVTAGVAAMIMAAAAVKGGWSEHAPAIMEVLDVHAGRHEVLGLGVLTLGPVDAARAAMARLLADELQASADGQLKISGMTAFANLWA